jgi:hypothetical protein
MRHISSLIEAREASSVPVWRQQENGLGAKYTEAECILSALRLDPIDRKRKPATGPSMRNYLRIVFPLPFYPQT